MEGEMKACPFCAEQILAAAIKCKHCGERLDGSSESKSEPEFKPLKPKSAWWVPSKGARWVLAIAVLIVGAVALGLGPKVHANRCGVAPNGETTCRYENLGLLPGTQCTEVKLLNKDTKDAKTTEIRTGIVWPKMITNGSVEVTGVMPDVAKTCGPSLATCAVEFGPCR
jgi:hypothetical protein